MLNIWIREIYRIKQADFHALHVPVHGICMYMPHDAFSLFLTAFFLLFCSVVLHLLAVAVVVAANALVHLHFLRYHQYDNAHHDC